MTVPKGSLVGLCFFAILTTAACDNSAKPQSDATPAAQPQAQPHATSNTSRFNAGSAIDPSSSKKRRRAKQEQYTGKVAAMQVRVSTLLHKNAGWQESHRAMQAFLNEPAPNGLSESLQRQMAADAMLNRVLLKGGTPSPEQQKAIGFYTDLLLKTDNTQGPLLASALDHLEGYWSKERIAKTAARALDATRADIAKAKRSMKSTKGSEKTAAAVRAKLEELGVNGAEGAVADESSHHEDRLRKLRQTARRLEVMTEAQ
jgi:hypothetical protein